MTTASAKMNGAMSDRRYVLLATSLGVLLAQIDTSVVNLALKSIAGDPHAGVSEMQWVIDAYNLVYATLLLTGGTLGDIYGRRRIFVMGVALFTAGTIVCALAPNAAVLIAGRVVSGLGAAFALPMSLVLLALAYPRREERAHAMGIWASCNGLAFIIGPTFGGWLVDSVGWRSIFYMSLPACAAALLITMYAIGESTEPKDRRLDLPGQVLAIVALGAFAFAAIEGSHWGWTSALYRDSGRRPGRSRVRMGGGANGRTSATAILSGPARVLRRARCRRPDDVRHVRAALHHAALFPDHMRLQPVHRRP